MKYCSVCGAAVDVRVPEGDHFPRHVCGQCGEVHYLNPKVLVGCIPRWEDKILLCRRAIEPRYGFWTLPAGFLENNETVAEGALRETWEEACASAQIVDLYTVFSLPHVNQVYVMFIADMTAPTFGPSSESLEVKLWREEEIPWDEIAFPVVEQTLRLYFADRKRGEFPIRAGDIRRLPGAARAFDVKMLKD
jgi:ADP-ribose pyrophosphatase YjhB (NUDIX family)